MSKIEVNAIEPQCGTTLTLGASGDTVTLACGASQSGFGRTGTVDWQTGSIKTATFTAVSGEGYFCNTTSGSFEVDLPAGSAGAIVSIQDYNNTFDTNSLTVDPNGSEKINGGVAGEAVTLNTEGRGVTFVYIDATVGWRSVQDNDFTKAGQPPFVAATGGTVTTSGDFKIHTFTSPGTFTVTNSGSPSGSDTVDYLVVAGGGGGGYYSSGGGGGGYRESSGTASGCYSASPLGSGVSALPVTAQDYPITVGGGGGGGPAPATAGSNGANSIFSTITSAGGGGAGSGELTGQAGNDGGSGGGSAPKNPSGGGTAGSGNTPPVSPPQGNDGGTAYHNPGVFQIGGGGGGATAVGQPSGSCTPKGGDGGAGATTSISATPTSYAGGGGGYSDNTPRPGGSGGLGGGGDGGHTGTGGSAGGTNTGGGGGAAHPGQGKNGGSGIVIIRYKYQ
jgi:hypothetical protein